MAKKATKKGAKKRTSSRSTSTKKSEVLIRVESAPTLPVKHIPTVAELIEPMHEGKKLTIPKTWMSSKQITWLMARTPKKHVYQRKGKGGQVFDYVTGTYIEKVLNFVFGWNWDFEIVEHGKDSSFVWVKGKLIVRNEDSSQQIVKMQFGRAEIKFLTEVRNGKKVRTDQMLDFGNDLKAAGTDALKKCASLLGIASDIYGKSEYQQESGQQVREEPEVQLQNQSVRVVEQPEQEYQCHGALKSGCGEEIDAKTHQFSKRVYGKPLCRKCQDIIRNK